MTEDLCLKAPVYAALDTVDVTAANTLATAIVDHVDGIKLGLEFFLANGHVGYRALAEAGLPIFLDLKLHDIPNTVAGAVRAIGALAPHYLTVHAFGGFDMMRAAVEAAGTYSRGTKLLGVTVLTSMDKRDLTGVGVSDSPKDQVRRLADLARTAGLHGVICSPHEIEILRAEQGPDFHLVVPGIRPGGAATGDQKRVMTPEDAIAAGATRLVIGRAISGAANPESAARSIAESLAQ